MRNCQERQLESHEGRQVGSQELGSPVCWEVDRLPPPGSSNIFLSLADEKRILLLWGLILGAALAARLGWRVQLRLVMCSSQDQNSSRSCGGLSMPKKEDSLPWRSRSRFTKAVKEETQLPIKWSAWPRMYRSIWATSGCRLTTFTCGRRAGHFSQGAGQGGQLSQGLQPYSQSSSSALKLQTQKEAQRGLRCRVGI